MAYDPLFKEAIVKLVDMGCTPDELATEFPPTSVAIRGWVKEARSAKCDDCELKQALTKVMACFCS